MVEVLENERHWRNDKLCEKEKECEEFREELKRLRVAAGFNLVALGESM
jgi:hypothetical protein